MSRGINLVALLFYFIGSSISQNYSTRLFSKDQGLPDPYVYTIQQDQKGFLWIAHGKGLSKFDGQLFAPIDTKFLGSDLIYASAIQKNGTLWFGTSGGKLVSSKSGSNKLDSTKFDGKSSITKILVAEFSGNIYLNTLGNGIFVKRGDIFTHIEGTEEYQVNDIALLDNKENVLAATSEGLFLMKAGSNATKIKFLNEGIKSVQKSKTKNNTFYILTERSSVYELEFDERAEISKNSSLSELKKENPTEIAAFFVDEEEQSLYSSTTNERLGLHDIKQGTDYLFNQTAFLAAGRSFFQDDEKNVWVATTGKGLYRITKNDYRFLPLDESVFSITRDGKGKNYYGTENGVLVYDAAGNFIDRISELKQFKIGKVSALYFDGVYIWIGTENKGLFIISPEDQGTFKFEFSSIKNIGVNSITGDGTEVVVTTNLEGVYTYKNAILQDHFSVETTLLHNNVYYSLRAKSGKVFYATHTTSFSYSEGKQLFEIDTKDLGLIADFNSLAEGKNGELYIGTNGDGLYVMQDKTLQPFGLNDDLESKFIYGLVCDNDNNVWILQRYHLYKYYTKEKALREIKFGTDEQFMFNSNSFFKNATGDLYFGTNKGLVHFSSVDVKDKLALPYLVSVSAQDSVLNSQEQNKTFTYGSYHFAIEFSALGLKNSENILFKYKLEGRDENWSELSRGRRAEFSKLGEGTYIFKVIAYNAEGFSSGEVALYSFSISSPFWKHPFFWSVSFLFLIGIIYLIIRVRTKKLIEAKNKLEELVKEKTKELRAEKEVVEKSNIRIEEQNAEIRDSITYAKRIQDALLPEKKILKDYQENVFVLYQPRDIVSGDFYWMAELGHLKFIVVADCTGHGVPGALMSMIGTTLLNKVVLERKVARPKDILKELDKEVKQALKQHTEDATRDGMDVCLCCVDTNNGKLIYAGAMRPLLFVREKQILEYTATKLAIGGFSYGNEKEFNETEIELKIGDMFYLFSDGYADQFGGEKGKKLMLKNFKKIVVSISEMDLVRQEENLKRVYTNWKGDLDQVDDVLVIGVRI
ncbi:hypothetical protein CNR22_08900 [Sphingobacteriaceae bacterium]|nr:hypothetical protein CNR22_08900 [Sphingobacteriaceae bacterium]